MLKKFTKKEREEIRNNFQTEPLYQIAELACSYFDYQLQAYVPWAEDIFNETIVIIDNVKENGEEYYTQLQQLWKNTYPRFREYDKTVPNQQIVLATSIVLAIPAIVLRLSIDITHQDIAKHIMEIISNNNNDQWLQVFSDLGNECNKISIPLRKWINDYMQLDNTQYISDDIEELFVPLHKPKKSPKKEIPFTIENMTFALGSTLIGNITLLYRAMRESKWIDEDTKPDDFTNLFCGKTCPCRIKVGNVGTDNIYALFNAMIDGKYIKLPEGYGMELIVRSHFINKDDSHIAKNSSKSSKKAASKIKEFCQILAYKPDFYD